MPITSGFRNQSRHMMTYALFLITLVNKLQISVIDLFLGNAPECVFYEEGEETVRTKVHSDYGRRAADDLKQITRN
jgi:hypothetical protein